MTTLLPDVGTVPVGPFLAVTIGILVLFIGKAINGRVGALREYNIPEPVTGGLLFAVAVTVLYLLSGYRLTFDLNVRDVLLVYFFTAIGIDAVLSDLKAGGRPLVILTVFVTLFMVLQNLVGMATAMALGRPAALGVLAGSISLLGGTGTAVAWAPAFAAQGDVPNALEISVLCATAGLVLAPLVGGPMVRALIERYHLTGPTTDTPTVGMRHGAPPPRIDYLAFLQAILAIHLSVLFGLIAHQGLMSIGFTLPEFVPCMAAGIVLTNLVPAVLPRVAWPRRTPALALISDVSLGVFLAMSLMSMQLWTLAELAGPLLVILAVQTVFAVLYVVFGIFPALRRSYDAAVIGTGFIGFGLGGMASAMANMTAVTQKGGASRVAFLVVPVVGAFFSSVLNNIAIQFFLSVL
jgi:glutamate:Na+ symporter, ESS family